MIFFGGRRDRDEDDSESGSSVSKASNKKNFKFEAGAAGASGGTLLILLVNNLPDNYVLKSWLVLIPPTISVAISAFWVWSKSQAETYLCDRKIKAILGQAINTLQEDLKNPFTSDEHKRQLCK